MPSTSKHSSSPGPKRRRVADFTSLFAVLVFRSLALSAQSPTAPSPPVTTPEVSTQDSQANFSSRTNLVVVRVVVRDKQGNIVSNLKKENFQLFDKGKAQTISNFSVEKPGGKAVRKEDITGDALAQAAANATPASSASLPERYVAYLFDDIHIEFSDLAYVRKAAERHLNGLLPSDRAAIYTTSGQTMQDFTDDRAKLQSALLHLLPRPIGRSNTRECPDISYYMADLVENKNDSQALTAAEMEINTCNPAPQQKNESAAQQLAAVEQQARSAARQQLAIGDQESRVSLSVLRNTIRRMAAMPGQRTIVVVSPGFLILLDSRSDESAIIDQALRSNIIISTLDARGVYTVDPSGDITKPPINPAAANIKSQYIIQSAAAQADLLAELADSTGGVFVHDTNDLDQGFKRTAASPETYYVLGFSPHNLKFDGSFHNLKVALTDAGKVSLQARRGYFAPKHSEDATETAKREINEALFSLDEMHDIPLQLHTQFFKSSEVDAKLSVVAHLDIRHIRYKKLGDRNQNDVTIVSGLFDRNGNFLMATEKHLELRLRDETLQSKLNSGLNLKIGFDVKPGSYLVRLVVRDAEGQQMSAQNGSVEIP